MEHPCFILPCLSSAPAPALLGPCGAVGWRATTQQHCGPLSVAPLCLQRDCVHIAPGTPVLPSKSGAASKTDPLFPQNKNDVVTADYSPPHENAVLNIEM